jgi:hypothetical protein
VINLLGKTFAVLFVGMSLMLLGFSLALYLNAMDMGWKQPARAFPETASRKSGDLGVVPGRFDKHEAAQRKLAREKTNAQLRLGSAQVSFVEVEPYLGDNHLKGDRLLQVLEKGTGDALAIKDFKYDPETGALLQEQGPRPLLGFPAMDVVLKDIHKSYLTYQSNLKDVDDYIEGYLKQIATKLKLQKEVTEAMTGKLDMAGNPLKENGGVVQPGWYYLLEAEMKAQQELHKELEYLQPLWVKERTDALQLTGRRDILKRRLEELGDKGYMSQSEFNRMKLK